MIAEIVASIHPLIWAGTAVAGVTLGVAIEMVWGRKK
ncbi:hypothetical protein QDW16_gp36 [Microbacterium phage Quenya]|nr:hypothetical protein QDW16_gp36 [Microbacterium phage Quenya]QOP64268.1 hypothetical protein SEA_QUENYA_33 [Microbacterium phage Quenya]